MKDHRPDPGGKGCRRGLSRWASQLTRGGAEAALAELRAKAELLESLEKLVTALESGKRVYLPKRTRRAGGGPPEALGEGQVALNLPDRRVWVGVADGVADGIAEVTSLDQLFDHWARTIERHAKPKG